MINRIGNFQNYRINFEGKKSNKLSNEEQRAMNNLYKKACNKIPIEGDFNTIAEKYQSFGDNYILYIKPEPFNDRPNRKALYIGYALNSGECLNLLLKDGNKKDMLDFLSNEKSLTKIRNYMCMLEEKASSK